MNSPTDLEDHHDWYRFVLEHHYEEARQRALSLLQEATRDENGCIVTGTASPRKLRFRGMQHRAYRFIFAVKERYPLLSNEVVRHRCDNRLCIHPGHLELGDRRENLQDHRGFRANGVDHRFL